ncbi:hypothetical protein ACFFVB_00390 [Formosa undariae]|uniref:Methylmalonyl Co-A mutase-associated GTPase MeaB n=1 Tax=Formosa undariae TaxID=1325436 RepID=A0ABV5EWG1_9FLAO
MVISSNLDLPFTPPASSTKNTGIDSVWEQVLKYKELVDQNGYFTKNRNHQKIKWMYNNINEELKHLFYGSPEIKSKLSSLEHDVVSSQVSPVKAAQYIMDAFKEIR